MEVGKKTKSLRQCACGCSGFRTMLTPDHTLIVYQQPLHDVCGTKTADNEKKTVVSALVIQNNYGNDVSLQTDVFLPEFELNKISCPRCRHHIGRAKALLKNVPVDKNNIIRYVCEICSLKQLATVPCLHCLNVLKKLRLSEYTELRGVDLLKQPDSPFLKTAFEKNKIEKLTKAFRAYSDIHLTDTVERISKHIQPLERPKSALDLDNIIEGKKVRISMQAVKERVTSKLYIWEDIDYQNKTLREPLHPILKPLSEQAIDHEKKTSYRSRAEAHKLKHESLLGIGTTGIMRRYHSEESLKSISASETNAFSFFFPRIRKEGKTLYKTSADLIMDTRKRLQAEIEEKIRKQEEKQKIKMGKEKGKGVQKKHEDDITKEKGRVVKGQGVKGKGVKGKGVKRKDEDDITKDKGKGVKGKHEDDISKEKIKKKITETKLGKDVEKEKFFGKKEKMGNEKGEKLYKENKKATTKGQTGKIKDEKTAVPKQTKTDEVGKTKEKKSTGPNVKKSDKELIKTAVKKISEVETNDNYTTMSQTDIDKKMLTEQKNRKEGVSEKDAIIKGAERDQDIIKKGDDKKKLKEGADVVTQGEINLVNKVLEKHEKMIAPGQKIKKVQQETSKSIKEKAENTIAKQNQKDEKPEFEQKSALKDVSMDKIKIQISQDDLILKMLKMKSRNQTAEQPKIIVPPPPLPPLPPVPHKRVKVLSAVLSEESDLSDTDSFLRKLTRKAKKKEIVCGTQIMFVKDVPPEPEPISEPVLFHSEYKGDELNQAIGSASRTENIKENTEVGVIRYALSNRKFIDNGWTVLPTEKIVRKVNVYRMHPAYPEFDWFEHNKKKGILEYSSGEKLAEIDGNGRGRWYYKNGRLALDYYDCKESNALQRYVIYSSGEPDERGRSTPITVLGMFDYNGNGVVFDHAGKIRLKYNQNEGVVLDRSVGPVSHWKWHTLNDPPHLLQVMIDSQLDCKDPEIFAYADEHEPLRQDETILAIEYDNFIKGNKTKKKKEFKPHQINMKTMKMNNQFTLRIMDQNRIYLSFRDGATAMKCNLGLKIDHDHIVDTTYCDLGEVGVSVEKTPPTTDSIASLQKSLKEAQRFNQVRTARELNKTPLVPVLSVDRMTSAASRPLRRPLQTEDLTQCRTANNLYYNTRLI